MDTEKIMPLSYVKMGEEVPTYKIEKMSKMNWFLAAYAVMITIAMVTVCVVGGLYIQQLAPNTVTDDSEGILDSISRAEGLLTPVKKYHVRSDDQSEEDIEIDRSRDREIIRVARGSGDYSLLVLDYKKNFGGIYDGESNGCFLLGGLDNSLPDAEQLNSLLENETKASSGVVKELDYAVQTDRPVTDLSLVPDELQTICWGKPVYWLYRINGQPQHDRQKRGVSGQVCYMRCSNVGGGRLCYRVCVNRG